MSDKDNKDNNMRNFMDQLQALDQLANEMDGYSDALEGMPEFGDMSELNAMSELNSMFGDLNGEGVMPNMPQFGMSGMPGMAGMPGQPKEIGLFDTVIVHGLRGEYKLTFEETEEGLVINMVE